VRRARAQGAIERCQQAYHRAEFELSLGSGGIIEPGLPHGTLQHAQVDFFLPERLPALLVPGDLIDTLEYKLPSHLRGFRGVMLRRGDNRRAEYRGDPKAGNEWIQRIDLLSNGDLCRHGHRMS